MIQISEYLIYRPITLINEVYNKTGKYKLWTSGNVTGNFQTLTNHKIVERTIKKTSTAKESEEAKKWIK